jgi:hypothetical protein
MSVDLIAFDLDIRLAVERLIQKSVISFKKEYFEKVLCEKAETKIVSIFSSDANTSICEHLNETNINKCGLYLIRMLTHLCRRKMRRLAGRTVPFGKTRCQTGVRKRSPSVASGTVIITSP